MTWSSIFLTFSDTIFRNHLQVWISCKIFFFFIQVMLVAIKDEYGWDSIYMVVIISINTYILVKNRQNWAWVYVSTIYLPSWLHDATSLTLHDSPAFVLIQGGPSMTHFFATCCRGSRCCSNTVVLPVYEVKCLCSRGREWGRVDTPTSFSIFDSYDMKSFWFEFPYDIFTGLKIPRV